MNGPRIETEPGHLVFLHLPKTAGPTPGNALVNRLASRLVRDEAQ